MMTVNKLSAKPGVMHPLLSEPQCIINIHGGAGKDERREPEGVRDINLFI
jgi:hypothetical protein